MHVYDTITDALTDLNSRARLFMPFHQMQEIKGSIGRWLQ